MHRVAALQRVSNHLHHHTGRAPPLARRATAIRPTAPTHRKTIRLRTSLPRPPPLVTNITLISPTRSTRPRKPIHTTNSISRCHHIMLPQLTSHTHHRRTAIPRMLA